MLLHSLLVEREYPVYVQNIKGMREEMDANTCKERAKCQGYIEERQIWEGWRKRETVA